MSIVTRGRTTRAWSTAGTEPALADVLTDPLVHAVMRRDGVSVAKLRRVIADARARLGSRLCRRCAA